jgi:FMN phosphatase YigB (HAD superfamily)
MEKKIAFDIGNVLCYVNINEFNKYIVDGDFNIFIRTEAVNNFLLTIQPSNDLGLYSIQQSFEHTFPFLSKYQLEQIESAWLNNIKISSAMTGLIQELLDHNWEVALLSNIGVDHSKKIREEFPILNKCIQHFSCEVGARKPTKLFFQSFQLQHNWPKSTLFFDDRIENINAANDFFTGIYFDIEKFKNDDTAADFVKENIMLHL